MNEDGWGWGLGERCCIARRSWLRRLTIMRMKDTNFWIRPIVWSIIFVLLKMIYGQFYYSDVIEEYRRDKEMCYCQDSYDSLLRYSDMILHGHASPVHLEVYWWEGSHFCFDDFVEVQVKTLSFLKSVYQFFG